MEFDFKITGFDEIQKKLEQVSQEARYRAGRSALRKATAEISQQVEENAKRIDDASTPEDISKNVTLRWNSRLFKNQKDLSFRVGIRGGAKDYGSQGEVKGKGKGNPGGDTFYWRFQEFGTEKIPAKGFFRSAIAQKQEQAQKTFFDTFIKSLNRALKKKK